MRLNKKYLADIIFFVVLIIVGVYSCLTIFANKEKGSYVIVRVNGEDVATYYLDNEGTYPLNGGTNLLIIEKGEAYLKDADCPDKLCVNQGKISKSGEVITCLPNKLTVTVYGGESDVDFIS